MKTIPDKPNSHKKTYLFLGIILFTNLLLQSITQGITCDICKFPDKSYFTLQKNLQERSQKTILQLCQGCYAYVTTDLKLGQKTDIESVSIITVATINTTHFEDSTFYVLLDTASNILKMINIHSNITYPKIGAVRIVADGNETNKLLSLVLKHTPNAWIILTTCGQVYYERLIPPGEQANWKQTLTIDKKTRDKSYFLLKSETRAGIIPK